MKCYNCRFAHESVGEGEDRHLVLERSEETTMLVKFKLYFYVHALVSITHIMISYEYSLRPDGSVSFAFIMGLKEI